MIKAIVTDIEGTTSSLSFVKEVLFPYARKHITEFVRNQKDDPQVASLIEDVCHEVSQPLSNADVAKQLVKWIDEDKKATPLKALQGLLWQKGYEAGDFKGHIYDDAKKQLEAWHQKGIKQYVYSSGSIRAQKLLFSHTEYGDLNYLFDDNFDTTIGGKMESKSYSRILEKINFPADQVLFLSDIDKELNAAKIAGMNTICLVRDGEIEANTGHKQVSDFYAVNMDSWPVVAKA